MGERLKTALYRTATFAVLILGAIACIACAVGLYHGHLPESNTIIRWTEIIVLSLNGIILIITDIKYVIEVIGSE